MGRCLLNGKTKSGVGVHLAGVGTLTRAYKQSEEPVKDKRECWEWA